VPCLIGTLRVLWVLEKKTGNDDYYVSTSMSQMTAALEERINFRPYREQSTKRNNFGLNYLTNSF
jgi:hypothetical protein